MKLSVLSCKGCGASLDFAVGVPSTECPYCGQTMKVESGGSSGGEQTFDAIIPLRHDRESFYEKTLEFLAEGDDTPDDLLTSFEVDEDLHAVFAPYRRLQVSYDGAMTCEAGREVVHYVNVRRGDRTVSERRVDIEWEPFSRNLKGRVTLDVCLADGVDETLLLQLQDATVDQSLARFEPTHVGSHGIQHAISEVEAGEVFGARGYPRLKEHVDAAAYEAAPSHSRNISTQFDYTVESDTPFLAGIWMQKYQYRGESYPVVMDGGSGAVFGYRPADGDRSQWLRQLEQLGHRSWFAAAGCAAVGFFAGGVGVWLVGAAIVGIGYLVSKRLREKVAQNSATLRQNLLSVVKSEGRGGGELARHVAAAETEYAAIRAAQDKLGKAYFGAVGVAVVLAAVGALAPLLSGGDVDSQEVAYAEEAPAADAAGEVTDGAGAEEAAATDAAAAAAEAAEGGFIGSHVVDTGSWLQVEVAREAEDLLTVHAQQGLGIRVIAAPSLDGEDIATAAARELQPAQDDGSPGTSAVLYLARAEDQALLAFRDDVKESLGGERLQALESHFGDTLREKGLPAALDALATGLRYAND